MRSFVIAGAAVAAMCVLPQPLAAAEKGKPSAAQPSDSVTVAPATVPAEPPGMVSMCNGKDLAGWDGNPKFWSVRAGVLTGETTKNNPAAGNTFCLWREKQPGDFDFRCTYRLTSGNPDQPMAGDSGIQIRSHELKNRWVLSGYQFEINNDRNRAGYLYHERSRKGAKVLVGKKAVAHADGRIEVVGSLGDKAAITAAFKPHDWNDCCIIFRGHHLMFFNNGVQTVDLIDDDPNYRVAQGILGLQIHAGAPMKVEFKNLRIQMQK